MANFTLHPPQPFHRSADLYDHDRKLLFREMWSRRGTLLIHYPHLLLHTVEPGLVSHVAALVLLWERWDRASGECPDCSSLIFAQSVGGLLSVGAVSGVCLGCGLISSRHIGGMSEVLAGCRIAVDGTPFLLALSPSRWRFDFRGIPEDLIHALRCSGAGDLPEPSDS